MRPAILRLLAIAAVLAAVPLAARAADNCGILSNTQISAVTSDPVLHAAGTGGDCIWSGKQSRIYISVRDSAGWSTGKNAFQKYGHITAVSGIGDDAYFMGPDPSPTLYALKGGHYIIVRVNVSGFSGDQTKSALKTLAANALGKL